MTFFINDPVRRVITPLPEAFYRRKITDPDALSESQPTKGILAPHGSIYSPPPPPITRAEREASEYTYSKDEDSSQEPVARELMSAPVICTGTSTPLIEIWEQFSHHNVHHIGLISSSGMLTGVASYESILEYAMNNAQSTANWWQVSAENLSQKMLITATPDASLTNLALVMLTHQVSAIPVVSGIQGDKLNGRRLDGIVTNSDILKATLRKKEINFDA